MNAKSRKYLLRVEGVNLDSIIDDTDQLSVRRGGGLMVLNAPRMLKSKMDPAIGDRLTEVATGASIGLFEFSAESDKDAEGVCDAVEQFLRTQSIGSLPLRHATFVVDCALVDATKPGQAVQTSIALNRWNQLKSPSLSLDGVWDSGVGQPCYYNRTRTAQDHVELPGFSGSEKQPLSESVRDRREYGREARQQFYQNEVGEQIEFSFTDDLQTLCGSEKKGGIPGVNANLIDKIAVFYVDGNGFGRIGQSILDGGLDGFRGWSTGLRDHHRRLLKNLIGIAKADPLWQIENKHVRLETLLWGGDEILWVVPAWKGWEVAKWFFGQQHMVGDRTLTYGAGLVFCHAKAPVKNIARLAHDLGDMAKSARDGENVHRLAYEVLESFDDITGDLSEHRERYLPPGHDVNALAIDPAQLTAHWDLLCRIGSSSELPRRQLYRFAHAWRVGEKALLEKARSRLNTACGKADLVLDDMLRDLGGDIAWLHILQMLPYLPAMATEVSVGVDA